MDFETPETTLCLCCGQQRTHAEFPNSLRIVCTNCETVTPTKAQETLRKQAVVRLAWVYRDYRFEPDELSVKQEQIFQACHIQADSQATIWAAAVQYGGK